MHCSCAHVVLSEGHGVMTKSLLWCDSVFEAHKFGLRTFQCRLNDFRFSSKHGSNKYIWTFVSLQLTCFIIESNVGCTCFGSDACSGDDVRGDRLYLPAIDMFSPQI